MQFNILLDETDILQDDLLEWRRLDQAGDPAPPLQIEIYLDTSHLNSSQALVLVDESGKRWDVADTLSSSADSSPQVAKNGVRYCEVVLERWTIQLDDASGFDPEEPSDTLPNIYKKAVVFFRSLYTFLRFLPAFKLYRKLGRQAGSNQALRLKFRLRAGGASLSRSRKDSLYAPLCSSEHRGEGVVDHHNFPAVRTTSGSLRCFVEYRQNCAFKVTDAESLLSSRFLGSEEGVPTLTAGRSLPSSHIDRARERYSRTVTGTGGGDISTRDRPRGLLGAYGSLGTFHATDKAGSPVSELRQRAEQADANNDDGSLGARRIPASSSRRVSLSLRDNPPFKAGSLASSPKASAHPSPSPSTSIGKAESPFLRGIPTQTSETSKRIPLNTTAPSQQQSRPASSIPNETAVASSGSTSPRPAPVKYSSSFANRHKRFASQGSKTADSGASSARGSSSSKEKSGQFNEGVGGVGGPSSSGGGGGKSDDDDIAAFISQIETANKELKNFRPPSSSSSSRAAISSGSGTGGAAQDNTNTQNTTTPHVVNLAKYTSLRETNAQLADEISSSSLFIAGAAGGAQNYPSTSSTTPPSRRLSNVPGLSTSSSPSRAQPHLPYVRSRLSTHSIVEEGPGGSSVVGASSAGGGAGSAGVGSSASAVGGNSAEGLDSPTVREPDVAEEEDDEPFIFQQDNV